MGIPATDTEFWKKTMVVHMREQRKRNEVVAWLLPIVTMGLIVTMVFLFAISSDLSRRLDRLEESVAAFHSALSCERVAASERAEIAVSAVGPVPVAP